LRVSIPPSIRDERVTIPSGLMNDIEAAMREITALDVGHGERLAPLGRLLLRAESVASSKIEHIHAGVEDYALALHGSRANESARSMVAATVALEAMIDDVGLRGAIDRTMLSRAHRALMQDDPSEHRYAGRLRDVQNWIGGSDHSPRGALFVPPPPERVDDLMADLMAFVNRDDMPALAQAALGHAQFESIHPFTDGNGRIGRALVNAVLRRRGATAHVVVPLASSLVAHRDRYFDSLTAYRHGDAAPIIAGFARATRIAAAEARTTSLRLGEIADEMRAAVGRVRSGGATDVLLRALPLDPVVTVDDAVESTGASRSVVYETIERLAEAGVLRPLTARKRNQVWGAVAVLDELEDLGRRIESASR
jgi:Fic family protein